MSRKLRLLSMTFLVAGMCALFGPFAGAQEPPPEQEEPTPEATGDIDDQSFADPGTYDPQSAEPVRGTEEGILNVANETVGVTLDYLNHSTAWMPGLVYSNAGTGLDAGIRYLKLDLDNGADLSGWSVFGRYRMTQRRGRDQVWNKAPYGSGLSAVGGYQSISSVGDLWALGPSYTVAPIFKHPSLRGTVAVQYLTFDPDAAGVDSRSTGSVSLALNYHDQPLGVGVLRKPAKSWRWSVGLGYRFANAVLPQSHLVLRVRWRPLVPKSSLATPAQKASQFSFSVGKDGGGDYFFGLGYRTTFVTKWQEVKVRKLRPSSVAQK